MSKVIKIGGAAGFWGDSAIATPQLLNGAQLDYLVFDYLAETTMAILARAKAKNPTAGYATDFVDTVIKNHLYQALTQGVKLVSNAGGLNPLACREAILKLAQENNLSPKIAVILGDDASPYLDQLKKEGLYEMFSHQEAPDQFWSASIYLGAQGISQALAQGADIVITGRCVDSALTLGILAHEFNWSWQEWDKLAAGSLAGHIIECGAQATGGLFTDWYEVPDWAEMSYPILECQADGSFMVTQVDNTGGIVTQAAIAEQMLYEIGDPSAYIMPDVICDFTQVKIQQVEHNKVKVSHAKGCAPTANYKVTGTYQAGYQLQILMIIRGFDAYHKAQKTAQALQKRTQKQMQAHGFNDYSGFCVEYLGTGSHYPKALQTAELKEIVLRLAAKHEEKAALVFLQREASSAGTSMGPGTRAALSGRVPIRPVVQPFSFLIDKRKVPVKIDYKDKQTGFDVVVGSNTIKQKSQALIPDKFQTLDNTQPLITVPLIKLAWARSGDKGNLVNIGVIARQAHYLPWIINSLTETHVQQWFLSLVKGPIERFYLEGINAINLVLHDALGGGGTASLRSDPLGKSFAQVLLEIPVQIPETLLNT